MQRQCGVLSYRIGLVVLRPVGSRWLPVSASFHQTACCSSNDQPMLKTVETRSSSRSRMTGLNTSSLNSFNLKQLGLGSLRRPVLCTRPSSSQVRWLSSGSYLGAGGKNINLNDLGPLPDVPIVPEPLPPTATVQELWAAGESVLEPLGIWSAYTPASYIRWGLESFHQHFDVPWWLCIVGVTVVLRLCLFWVPVLSQRNAARMQQHAGPLSKFDERMQDAKAEGDNQGVHYAMREKSDYMKRHGMSLMRQFQIMAINGMVFMSYYIALKKMANADMPGFSTEGLWWFTDLAAYDPLYILPIISAVTVGMVIHVGIETGVRSDQMSRGWTPYVMKFGLPTVVLMFSTFHPAALCVYWCTSNTMSLIYAGVFRIPAVRRLLKIPIVDRTAATLPKKSIGSLIKSKKTPQQSTLEEMSKRDDAAFKKAGQSAPRVSRAPPKKSL